jgi:hypothetical protein
MPPCHMAASKCDDFAAQRCSALLLLRFPQVFTADWARRPSLLALHQSQRAPVLVLLYVSNLGHARVFACKSRASLPLRHLVSFALRNESSHRKVIQKHGCCGANQQCFCDCGVCFPSNADQQYRIADLRKLESSRFVAVNSVRASSLCSRIFDNLAADRMRPRLCAAKTFQYSFAEKYRRHIISNASPSKMERTAVVTVCCRTCGRSAELKNSRT